MRLPLPAAFAVCAFLFAGLPVCHAQSNPTNLWTLPLESHECNSSPALAPDGTIYQGTFDGRLFAVTPQGRVKWTFKAGREIRSSPAVANDGTIYFGSRDWKLYAVTPEGKLKWAFPTGAWVDSSPAIAADGTIYFGSWDTNFYALNPDGSKKWIFPTGGIIDSSPAIAADGTIYFGSHDKKFYALKPDGKLLWSFATGAQIVSSPAVNSDGTVYFTSTDGNLYALKPDGTERWHLRTGGAAESSPVLDEDGNICVGVNECFFMFTKEGKKIWWWCTALDIDQTPAVAANGLIYLPTSWRRLAAVNLDDSERWHLDCGSNISDSPGIGPDGTVYASNGGVLLAINSPNQQPPAKSSWPMWRANPQHTGRVQAAK